MDRAERLNGRRGPLLLLLRIEPLHRHLVDGFERVTNNLREHGYAVISEVDHPIARMVFFDTYKTMGVVTEIMGITPEGMKAIEKMKLGQ